MKKFIGALMLALFTLTGGAAIAQACDCAPCQCGAECDCALCNK